MATYFSLQGSMAVGKTTAAKYIEKTFPNVHVSYEEHNNVKRKIGERNLNKDNYEDYIEIQKIWIESAVKRYNKNRIFENVLMDFGSEDIEFYTYNYPASMGYDWDIVTPLKDELELLSKHQPDHILFLNADEETIRKRKENDNTVERRSFEHHISKLFPLKKQWFIGKENVTLLDVDRLTMEEMCQKVADWINSKIN